MNLLLTKEDLLNWNGIDELSKKALAQALLAIELKAKVEELEKENERLTKLNRIYTRFGEIPSLESQLEKALELLKDICEAQYAAKGCHSDNQCYEDCWDTLWDSIKEAEQYLKQAKGTHHGLESSGNPKPSSSPQ